MEMLKLNDLEVVDEPIPTTKLSKTNELRALGFARELTDEKILSTLAFTPYALEKREILNYLISDFLDLSSQCKNLLDIIFLYDDFLDSKDRIQLIFYLDDEEIIKDYIKKNENKIRDYLKKAVLIARSLVLPKDELLLSLKFNREFCMLNFIPFTSSKGVNYFYEYFKDEIFYPETEELKRIVKNGNIFKHLSDETFLPLINDKDSPNYKIVLEDALSRINGHIYISFACFLGIGFEARKHNLNLDDEFVRSELNFRSWLKPELKDFEEIDENYFRSLEYLKRLPKKERKKHFIYQKTYNLFLQEFLKYFKDELGNEEYQIIEKLFERIINGLSFFFILKIDNLKTLYHFYKTNDLKLEEEFTNSLEEIKNYNAKQYLKMLKYLFDYSPDLIMKYQSLVAFQTLERFVLSSNFLPIFIYYGFDFLYQLKDKINDYYFLFQFGITEVKDDTEYKKLFMELIPELVELNSHEVNKILGILTSAYNAAKEIKNGKRLSVDYLKTIINDPTFLLLPNNEHLKPYLEKLNLIKKGNILDEKYKAIVLYNYYRDRILSSIPDISGSIQNLDYEMVPMHAEEILTNGIDRYVLPKGINVSCLTPNGKAASSLNHGATNPHGRFFKITHGNHLLCYSWVWRAGDVLCFDNIEVTDYLRQIPNYEELVYQVYYEAAKKLVDITSFAEEKGIKFVVIGRTPKDVKISPIDNLEDTRSYGLSPFSPNNSENLYLEDSKVKQVVIYEEGKPESTDDVTPIYKSKRKDVIYFEELTDEILAKLKSIYFDYCLENCEKPEKHFRYVKGYIGEDWFLGIDNNGNKEFYYHGNDERLFDEARQYGYQYQNVNYIKSKQDRALEIIESKVEAQEDFFDYLRNLPDQDTLILPQEFYFHSVSYHNHQTSLEAIMNILKDGAIGSCYSRKLDKASCNSGQGYYYICITKSSDSLYGSIGSGNGFHLSPNVFCFKTLGGSTFNDEKYPYQRKGGDGEYQVFGNIPANKFLTLQLNPRETDDKLLQIGKISYLLDFLDMDIPLISTEHKIIDRDLVRKLVRLK